MTTKNRAVFDRATLLSAAARTVSIADRKSPLRVLSMFRLSWPSESEGCAELAASNLITSSRDDVLVAECTGKLAVLVPAEKLVATLRAFSGELVAVEEVDEGKLRLSCGKSKIHVATLPADDFPDETRDASESGSTVVVSVPSNALAEALRHGAVCMFDGEDRPHMNGALLNVLGETSTIRVIATDGHRLARCDVICDKPGAIGGEVEALLLPKRCVEELDRFAQRAVSDVLRIEVGKRSVEAAYVDADGCSHSMFLKRAPEDVRFPPWEKVMRRLPATFSVAVESMLSAFDVAAAAHGRGKKFALTLSLQESAPGAGDCAALRITATSEDGDADAADEVEIHADAYCAEAERDRALCAAYVEDALRSLRDAGATYIEVNIGYSNDAVIFSAKTEPRVPRVRLIVDHVVMPMRV